MATITRVGFGQVEPNHLSAQRTAQIYAQLPAAANIDVLENGQFVKYDYAAPNGGEVNFSGKGEWMMVFNEVKLYDDFWRESYKDFAMVKDNYTPGSDTITHNGVGPLRGQMVPRVFKINVGDHWTTNCLGVANTSGKAVVDSGIEAEDLLGKSLKVGATGYLELGTDDDFELQVVKVYTLADGQAAVKVMRIK